MCEFMTVQAFGAVRSEFNGEEWLRILFDEMPPEAFEAYVTAKGYSKGNYPEWYRTAMFFQDAFLAAFPLLHFGSFKYGRGQRRRSFYVMSVRSTYREVDPLVVVRDPVITDAERAEFERVATLFGFDVEPASIVASFDC